MTNEIKPIASKDTTVPAIIKPNEQLAVIKTWTEGLENLTKTQAYTLTQKEKEFGVSIITGLVDRCVKDGIDTRKLNLTQFLEQVKHNSRMGYSLAEQDIYIDLRNDKNTGLINVVIRKQYQGIQKNMTRFCTKKIVRFADGIVCKGDEFDYSLDFNTGLNKITFKPDPKADTSKLENITHAFAIAYVEEMNTLVPYVCVIDKTRIMRAFNASTAKDRGPWSSDTARMVRKTAYWCLYNDIFKPFIEIPSNLQESFAATQDEMEFEEQNQVDNTVYDIPTDETVNDLTVEAQEESEQSFEDYLTEQEKNEIKEIFYSEYKNNKEKYNLIEGSWDEIKKTVKVTLK